MDTLKLCGNDKFYTNSALRLQAYFIQEGFNYNQITL